MNDAMQTTNDGLLDNLEIIKTTRRNAGSGTWVIGRIGGHRFDALVFPEHAESEDCEMGKSKISKLWIRCETTKKVVCNFDRGWDIHPTTDDAATITDFLAMGLADFIYAE